MNAGQEERIKAAINGSGGGGGGGGDASAAKQDTGNTSLASLDTKTPTIGQKTAAGSQSVVPSSDGPFATNFGVTTDTAATTDTGTFSFMAFVKRILQGITVGTVATTVLSTALETSHVLKGSAGSLKSLSWLNTRTTSQYLLIMNSATVPGDGAVTLLYPPIFMPATSNGMVEFDVPLAASAGISVSNSSTGTFTKTIGSADMVFTAQVQ